MSEKDKKNPSSGQPEEEQTWKFDGMHDDTLTSRFNVTNGPTIRRSRKSKIKTPDLPKFTDQVIGRFPVIRLLGEGGMGIVYEAYDRDLLRTVAIKLIKRDVQKGDDEFQRFFHEAQINAQLKHPNIIPVYEMGIHDNKPYLVMQPVEGLDLKTILNRLRAGNGQAKGRYNRIRLLQILQQVCQGIGFANDHGVVHRDLKPANIMIGEYGEVYVMDLGLAKIIGSADESRGKKVTSGRFQQAEHTMEGEIAGTPYYMAPEQAKGEMRAIDARTDVWALGVILYELLTWEKPFIAGSPFDILEKVIQGEFVPPRQRTPERNVPIALEDICLKALSLNQDDRYPTATAMADDIQAFIEGAKQREMADQACAKGLMQLEKHAKAKHRHDVFVEALRRIEKNEIRGWSPLAEHRALLKIRQTVRRAKEIVINRINDAIDCFLEAIGHHSGQQEARSQLASIYWQRYLEAEETRNQEEMAFALRRTQEYDDGQLAEVIQGDGSLELTSNPEGAQIFIYRYEEKDWFLVPKPYRRCFFGVTPMPEQLHLPMGSYLVILSKEGYRDVRYPVYISRQKHWKGEVNLYTDSEIGAGFVYVPAGEFICGGDPDAAYSKPKQWVELEDFFMQKYPVTCSEYLAFLNDLVRQGREQEAEERVPRDQHGPCWVPGESGEYRYPLEQETQYEYAWQDDWPVFSISQLDALAYARWLSQRHGRVYDLPKEDEWEKADRGVDGRRFPYGNEGCDQVIRTGNSQELGSVPESVRARPQAKSSYGVYRGGVSCCTSESTPYKKSMIIIRGHGFHETILNALSARRNSGERTNCVRGKGFRLVFRPSGKAT